MFLSTEFIKMYCNLIQSKIIPPSEDNLERILKCIGRLQKADSPLDKLESLLAAISSIFNSVSTFYEFSYTY